MTFWKHTLNPKSIIDHDFFDSKFVHSTFEMWTQSCNLYGRNCFILIRSLSFHEYLINDVPIWKCRNTKQLLRQHNVAKNFMKSNQNSELLLYNLRLKTKVKYSKVHYKAIPISANFFSKLFSIVPKNTDWVLFFDILTHNLWVTSTLLCSLKFFTLVCKILKV